MMETAMHIREKREARVEVHRYRLLVVAVSVFVALVFQAFVHKFGNAASYIELPLLVTVYFGLSRRNPSTGLLLGMIIGLLQDGLSQTPIGFFGISKTVVGYAASLCGARIEVDHFLSRFLACVAAFYLQLGVLALIARLLLLRQTMLWSRQLLIASAVNALLGAILFPLLDRFRQAD
jgi:rod shape-determining protein MreD